MKVIRFIIAATRALPPLRSAMAGCLVLLNLFVTVYDFWFLFFYDKRSAVSVAVTCACLLLNYWILYRFMREYVASARRWIVLDRMRRVAGEMLLSHLDGNHDRAEELLEAYWADHALLNRLIDAEERKLNHEQKRTE